MTVRANKPISVTLGPFADKVERRVRDGEYASASEVVRAGLRALDQQEKMFDQILKAKVAESLADNRATVSIEELDRSIEEWYEAATTNGA